MRGQPELRDPRIVDEPALHHEPADHALQPAQHEDEHEPRRVTRRNAPLRDEPEQRHEEHDADEAPEQAMEVLPPEDALELVQGHALVHLLVLGRLLVTHERLLPLGFVERRQRAHDRLPLGDRQPRMREARHAPDHHHREHEHAAREEPRRDLPARARFVGRRGVHGGRRQHGILHRAHSATSMRGDCRGGTVAGRRSRQVRFP